MAHTAKHWVLVKRVRNRYIHPRPFVVTKATKSLREVYLRGKMNIVVLSIVALIKLRSDKEKHLLRERVYSQNVKHITETSASSVT